MQSLDTGWVQQCSSVRLPLCECIQENVVQCKVGGKVGGGGGGGRFIEEGYKYSTTVLSYSAP